MRLLLCSDLHQDAVAARRIAERSSSVDAVVCAGDLANGRRGLETCIRELRSIRVPTVLVPGNNESVEELRASCVGWNAARVLHGTDTEIHGIRFFGIGGGIPTTPFGAWSWDFTEEQAERLLALCSVGGVMVSHSPPHGVADIASNGRHLGSVAVRRAMDRCQPKLLVCGHVHASAGQRENVGSTVVVNAGPGGVVETISTPQTTRSES